MNTSEIKHKSRGRLDRTFDQLKGKLPVPPKRGWIAEMRWLLIMTTTQLARRIGVAQSVVSNFEKSEREKGITLKSLEKVANAMECDFYYLFVPRKGLEAELYERAEKLYKENEKRLEHHMRLEQQGESESAIESARTAHEILKLYKRVWDEK